MSAQVSRAAVYCAAPITGFLVIILRSNQGQKVEVEFRTGATIALSDFRRQLKIRTMADALGCAKSASGGKPPSNLRVL